MKATKKTTSYVVYTHSAALGCTCASIVEVYYQNYMWWVDLDELGRFECGSLGEVYDYLTKVSTAASFDIRR